MKVPVAWLEKYCPHGLPPEDLARRLTMTGTAVESVESVGSETVLTLEVTSNRPDLLGVMGVAREVSALTGAALNPPDAEVTAGGPDVSTLTSVENKARKLCPLYTAKVITDVEIGDSPPWLRDILTSVGLRPVNNVVDITNYVMLETGQPLHAFDMDKLAENRIVVRRARSKEKMTAIDGTECALTKDDLVIADARQPVAIAGVMGGLHSEVDSSTKNILLESAMFDPYAVRQTSRRTALASDSSYRFERGVTCGNVMLGSDRACRLILELAGGTAAKGTVIAGKLKEKTGRAKLRWSRLNKLLGIDVPKEDAVTILKNLGLSVKTDSKRQTTFVVPESRPDLQREVDLIEEVVRVWGYEKVPAVSTMKIVSPEKQKTRTVAAGCRSVLVGAGFYELVTPGFVGKEDCFDLWTKDAPLALRNPVRENEPFLRKSLLGSVLRAVKTNSDRGNRDCSLFELAKAYLPAGDVLPEERTLIAAASPSGFDGLKGVLESVLEVFGVAAAFNSGHCPPFEAGRTARIELADGRLLGWIGEVSASLLERLDIKQGMSAFEIDADAIVSQAVLFKRSPALPRFPSVSRDYAVVVGEDKSWAGIEVCVRDKGSALVEDVTAFDVYRNEEIGAGRKSVAFSVTYRAEDRTLTGQEVDEIQGHIISALESNLGAILRK